MVTRGSLRSRTSSMDLRFPWSAQGSTPSSTGCGAIIESTGAGPRGSRNAVSSHSDRHSERTEFVAGEAGANDPHQAGAGGRYRDNPVHVQYLSTTTRHTVLISGPACLPHPGVSSCQTRAVWLTCAHVGSRCRSGSPSGFGPGAVPGCPFAGSATGRWPTVFCRVGPSRCTFGGRSAGDPVGCQVGYCRFRPSPHVYAFQAPASGGG